MIGGLTKGSLTDLKVKQLMLIRRQRMETRPTHPESTVRSPPFSSSRAVTVSVGLHSQSFTHPRFSTTASDLMVLRFTRLLQMA